MAPLKIPTIQPWQLVLGMVGAVALERHHSAGDAQPEQSEALVSLIILVVVVGLSLLAGYLIAKKNKATLKDDKPTTTVTRGTFVHWLIGIRRLGPLFCWAGDRGSVEESSGKKGGGAPKQRVWHENGWHLLCIGPCDKLHRILQNGEAIFQGPITSLSHPSGSFIDVGTEGGFFIYWGEPDQPANTWLGESNRVGVSSRWPYHCYVVWAVKRLGQSANWPLLDYEIEKGIDPADSNLVLSNPEIAPTRTLTGTISAVFDIDALGPSPDRIIIQAAVAQDYPPESLARLAGNALPDQDLDVLFAEHFNHAIGVYPPSHPNAGETIYELRTRVNFANGALTGADVTGTLQSYEELRDLGINPAHAIDQMLHATWPAGMGLPTTGPFAAFDLDTLEDLGILMGAGGAEELRSSWIAIDGDPVQTLLGTGLQDMGVMVPLDPISGKIKFIALREPSGILARIRDDLIVGELPETEVLHADRPADRLTFSFPDRNLVDRDGTIAVMDDGQIESGFEMQNARGVQITITTNFGTASVIAQRRSQEELAGGAAVKLKTNRATRNLLPGDAITVDALPEIMRVASVKLNTETNTVLLELMADFYGVPKSPFVDTAPPEDGGLLPVEPDLLKRIFEVSEYVLGAEASTLIMPRIRAHSQTFSASMHVSADNISYILKGDEFDLQTGGTLSQALLAPNKGGASLIEGGLAMDQIGPEFTVLGPDIAGVLDLTSDLPNWRIGRQLVIIFSTAGTEVCFLRNVTAVAGDTWRLDGLIRARYETVALDHPIGSEVYIFDTLDVFTMQDPLFIPGSTMWGKTQPQAGGILPLDADIPVATTLYGSGLAGRPVPASGLAVVAPDLVNAYTSGDDIDFAWAYATPQTPSAGAGLQPAGDAIASDPPPDGDFVLEIRDITGVTIHRTETRATADYTYTNANLVSDLGGGEPSFLVYVQQRRGGLLSTPIILTVERF